MIVIKFINLEILGDKTYKPLLEPESSVNYELRETIKLKVKCGPEKCNVTGCW